MIHNYSYSEKPKGYFSNARKVYSVLFALSACTIGYILILQYAYSVFCGLMSGKGLTDLGGYPIGHDFLAFWTATKLALTADPSSIYNLEVLKTAEKAVSGTDSAYFAWNYPPTFLLFLLPLSVLPYLAAYCVWILGLLCGFASVVHRIFPRPFTPWLFMALPPVIWNLIAGQNGSLSAAILGSGIILLDRRPFTGGVVLGLLSYKPHLTAMIPIALIAGRYWRALLGFAISGAVLVLISIAVFGTSVWNAFWQNVFFAFTHWQTVHFWPKMASVYALIRFTGAHAWIASIAQACVTISVAAIAYCVWRRAEGIAVKGSVLAICSLLASPYLFHGDMVIIGLAFAWLGNSEYDKEGNGILLLMLFWLGLFLTTDSLLVGKFNFSSIICISMLGFALSRGESRYSFRCIHGGNSIH